MSFQHYRVLQSANFWFFSEFGKILATEELPWVGEQNKMVSVKLLQEVVFKFNGLNFLGFLNTTKADQTMTFSCASVDSVHRCVYAKYLYLFLEFLEVCK